jgi:predicted MPP superfamily phosphohydrolase
LPYHKDLVSEQGRGHHVHSIGNQLRGTKQMFTIMHISDLHRSATHPVTNNELISCLVTDLNRYHTEPCPIAAPDALIVSGDLVTGLPRGSREYPEGLKHQYEEALDFLERLTNTFFDGDRSRVIIAPGNHDVDCNKTELISACAAFFLDSAAFS